MGFILNVVDLAMLNLIKSAAYHSVYNNIAIKFLYSNIFIISQVDKSSAANTVDLGSITGLVAPKFEKSLHFHPASRLDTSNKIGSVKLSPSGVDRWANDSLFSKNERFFCCLYNCK